MTNSVRLSRSLKGPSAIFWVSRACHQAASPSLARAPMTTRSPSIIPPVTSSRLTVPPS
ncbi:hypothetical protein [Nonomuraea dietziae]|uniref:hypothetical protein n=1 Tax=Nonomuraea dietziae TaxID=65515 RepID=UPI0031D05D5D